MKAVDELDFPLLLRVAAVVARLVVAFGHADGGVAAIAALVREHERRDARRIGLEREHEQVGEHADVLGVVVGNACRPRGAGQGAVASSGLAAIPLDLADRGQVLVELALVAGAEPLRELRRVVAHEVEDALLARGTLSACIGRFT